MKKVCVTKQIEFDAGHRLPNHASKCKNLHGHRYQIDITIEGEINDIEGHTEQGMVVDFSVIKQVAEETILKPWDHAFFVYKNDSAVLDFLNTMSDHKTIITDLPPTAEYLAQLAFDNISLSFKQHSGDRVKLKSLKLYETPTSWAEVNPS
ncbi:MAG: 6-carboxytetrahydropterin synthase QueD [Bdellovibrionaceae bacterium]|jgi:6-pyruvoyltetrahydropterin/6-carboxytetrahydropterin synthase|nr:6-carboxytetrahydropterin synthase QueD [Pseudobdellovibrionaceae bacterium]